MVCANRPRSLGPCRKLPVGWCVHGMAERQPHLIPEDCMKREGEAPAEPLRWPAEFRLGRSLALPFGSCKIQGETECLKASERTQIELANPFFLGKAGTSARSVSEEGTLSQEGFGGAGVMSESRREIPNRAPIPPHRQSGAPGGWRRLPNRFLPGCIGAHRSGRFGHR